MSRARAKRLLIGFGAAALLAGAPLSQALAATATTTFSVTATVTTTCSIVASSNMAFGSYAGVQADSTSTLSATCSNLTPYNIGLDAGTGTGATVTDRKMTGPGSDTLTYHLFRDSGRTLNWGNTVGTDTVSSTGTGSAQSFTIYGRLPASQFVQSGGYSDTITVTLTF